MAEVRAGWHDGTLYCYGGCGTRYQDFPRDVHLPTPLWNRIAVGGPFDAKDQDKHEGRGGVLCPACIVQRLAALPDCTVIHMDIDQRVCGTCRSRYVNGACERQVQDPKGTEIRHAYLNWRNRDEFGCAAWEEE